MAACDNELRKKNKFLARKILQLYEQELRRGDAIHRQSERLPVLQTIFFTALYTILPQLLTTFCAMKNLIWTFTAITTAVGIVSLIFTLLAQWRFHTNDVVELKDVKKFINKFYDKKRMGCVDIDIESNFTIEMFSKSLSDRKVINRRRGTLLSIAMYLFMATVIGSLFLVLALCIGG